MQAKAIKSYAGKYVMQGKAIKSYAGKYVMQGKAIKSYAGKYVMQGKAIKLVCRELQAGKIMCAFMYQAEVKQMCNIISEKEQL